MKSRTISGAVVVIYLAAAFFMGGSEAAFRIGIFMILPLCCIWFGDSMGGYTGPAFGRGAITSPTPGAFVAFGGWLVLLLPAIVTAILVLSGKR